VKWLAQAGYSREKPLDRSGFRLLPSSADDGDLWALSEGEMVYGAAAR
jgi:hypothetical protein